MASTSLPVQAFLVKHLAPPPFLLLFLLLLLSLLLALALLHINDLLLHSLSSRPLLHFLSPPRLDHSHAFLSPLLHLHHHYLGFLLSPCPIFILANLIIFTLLLKSFYLSSSSSSSFSSPSDFSDFAPEKSEYGGARAPERVLPSHEDFFLFSPPHQQYVFSPDPPEEYHILSFGTNEESTCFTNVQSYSKLNNKWENKGMSKDPYISSNIMSGAVAQKEVKRPDKPIMVEKMQSTLPAAPAAAAVAAPAYKVLNVEQGKVIEKAGALQGARLDTKTTRSVKAAAYASPGGHAVVINMEPPPARRARIPTSPSHPLLPAPITPSSHPPAKAAPLPLNTCLTLAQRPPSSPKVKKSLQSSGGLIITSSDGRHEASKPLLDGEKQAAKPNKPQKMPNYQNSMVRSNSDQRLSQQTLNSEVAIAYTSSSSFTNRPHIERAQSLRSSRTPDTITSSCSSSTIRPHMQRAQSLRSSSSPDTIASSQVARPPSFSETLDGLSDAEANKCFSDYITHRFALMKKEFAVHST